MTTAMRDAISPDLRATLRALKLGQMLHTLPDRLALARQQNMTHADFLELVLADEHARREAKSASLRARAAGLEAGMRLDTWDPAAAVRYDQQLWNELASLRFLDAHHGALLLGPVGVGKTHLACALGHIAIRRRRGVHMARADKLFKRLKAARLDNSHDAEMRKLIRVDLLLLDDFALQAFDALDTSDIYDLIVERHRAASTVITSNREPIEWLGQMADALLAQSAIDRLQSAAYELVLDGESYRKHQKPGLDVGTTTARPRRRRRA